MDKNLFPHPQKITRQDREVLNGHPGRLLWFTGLSGSGKSTLAMELERQLYDRGVHTYTLDGDTVRFGLNKDLGFSPADRQENIRRVAEVARIMVDAGLVVITSLISPYKADREAARALFASGEFVEIYVRCSLEECEARDPKGLYKKARQGQIPEFTGISAPYEEPDHPELIIDTQHTPLPQCVAMILKALDL